MRIWFSIVFVFFIAFFGEQSEAQNIRKAYKTGVSSYEKGEFIRAEGWLTRVIQSNKTKYNKAYIYRAKSYSALGKESKAVEDYMKATQLFPENKEVALAAAQLLFELNRYNQALQYATITLDRDSDNFEALKLQVLSLTITGKAESALIVSEDAARYGQDAELLYAKALASDSLGLKDYAIAYYREAIHKDSTYKPPYHPLGRLLAKNGYLKKSVDIFTLAAKQFDDVESYRLRSILHGHLGNIQSQINDISEILIQKPARVDLFLQRARLYKKVSLLQNALSDVDYYLAWDSVSARTWLLKGQLLEQLYMKTEAINAFKKVLKYATNQTTIDYAKQALFRLNEEKIAPDLVITKPKGPNDSAFSLSRNQSLLLLKGYIIDSSAIDSLMINNTSVDFQSDDYNTTFTYRINTDTIQQIQIEAIDAYQNKTAKIYHLIRTEKQPPRLILTNPELNKDSIIKVTQKEMLVKGFFVEQSALKSLKVAGKNLSFSPRGNRYYFSDKLDIANIDTLSVVASDIFQNTARYQFPLHVPDSIRNSNLATGKTWVVLISSDSIDGQVNTPVRSLKDSLINAFKHFELDSIILYDKISKEQFERKLLFELPEQTRKKRVDAILIYYIGPGLSENGFSYWIFNSAQKKKKFEKLNTSIFRTALKALDHVNYTTILSESVYPAKSIFIPSEDALPVHCEKMKQVPSNGQLAIGIQVDSWHNYHSAVNQALWHVIDSSADCFSFYKLSEKEQLPLKYGVIKGIKKQLFPVILYRKK